MEGGISQERTTNAKRRNTNYRIGEEGANEEMENDVMEPDFRSALEALRTA